MRAHAKGRRRGIRRNKQSAARTGSNNPQQEQLWAAREVNGDFEKRFARVFQLLYNFQTRLQRRNADVAQLVEQRSRKA